MSPKERARKVLEELPLSKRQRELYLKGLDQMTEDEARSVNDELEKSLNEASVAVEALRSLLKRWRNKK